MDLFDFLDLLGLPLHGRNSDLDRWVPDRLMAGVSEMTGTDPDVARRTLLSTRVRALYTDKLQIETRAWPWMIPVGGSRRFGRTYGLQACPFCLASDPPYFKWQWATAIFCCCQAHGTLLIDSCPRCSASIHASSQGLLGAARGRMGVPHIRVECCSGCGFDLRRALPASASEHLLEFEAAYESELAAAGKGTESSDRFAVLRHLITLLFGENRGLENLRRVVASRSGTPRIDVPIPYEPDQDIVPFEEANVSFRSKVVLAAHWLFQDWPERFIDCCQEAKVQYPALNRNAIQVLWFCEVATSAYGHLTPTTHRKAASKDIPLTEVGFA